MIDGSIVRIVRINACQGLRDFSPTRLTQAGNRKWILNVSDRSSTNSLRLIMNSVNAEGFPSGSSVSGDGFLSFDMKSVIEISLLTIHPVVCGWDVIDVAS